MDQSSREQEAMRVAQRWARKLFRGDPERDVKAQDAAHIAWEFAQTAPPELPGRMIAFYAVKRVVGEREFSQSVRSIDGPKLGRRKPSRITCVDLEQISRDGDNPADIAVFRLTFRAWLEQLTPRQRAMVLALAQGDKTGEVATQFHCTSGNVSQFRRRLAESWEAFTA